MARASRSARRSASCPDALADPVGDGRAAPGDDDRDAVSGGPEEAGRVRPEDDAGEEQPSSPPSNEPRSISRTIRRPDGAVPLAGADERGNMRGMLRRPRVGPVR